MELVRRLWSSDSPISHHGKHYQFDNVAITPKPIQHPIPAYVASFSQPSIELAGKLGCGLIVAPFAAAMSFGGLEQVAQLYKDSCARHGQKPARLMCSYFTHFADTKAEEDAARARQIRYYKECVIAAFPGDPAKAPPSYRYFIGMVERLQKVQPEDLTENSVLWTQAGGTYGRKTEEPCRSPRFSERRCRRRRPGRHRAHRTRPASRPETGNRNGSRRGHQ